MATFGIVFQLFTQLISGQNGGTFKWPPKCKLSKHHYDNLRTVQDVQKKKIK